MELSAIGLSEDGLQALVYLGNQRDRLAGAGYLVVLSQVTGEWQFVKSAMVWIS
jgi:hypothetical protein